MSKAGNKQKNDQLNMHYGTACNKLRKAILFNLVQRCGLDDCFQCGEKIETIEELSIEHKMPFLNSEDPVKLFFDIDNIAFSHLKCNVAAHALRKKSGNVKCGTMTKYGYGCRCEKCRAIKSEMNKKFRSKEN